MDLYVFTVTAIILVRLEQDNWVSCMSVLTQLFGNVQTSTDYQNLVALKMNKPLSAQD
jgi:hypothetical protein